MSGSVCTGEASVRKEDVRAIAAGGGGIGALGESSDRESCATGTRVEVVVFNRSLMGSWSKEG